MIRQSNDHLTAAGEGYFEHFRFASTVGLMAIAAGLACLIHALVPAFCTRTASRTIGQLKRLIDQRDLLAEAQEEAREATAFAALLLLATVVSAPLWVLDAPTFLRAAYTSMAFALPFTLLLSNRELARTTD